MEAAPQKYYSIIDKRKKIHRKGFLQFQSDATGLFAEAGLSERSCCPVL